TLMRRPRSRSFESGYHARAPLTLIGKPPSRSAHRAHRRLSLRFLELEPRVETLGMSRGRQRPTPKAHAKGPRPWSTMPTVYHARPTLTSRATAYPYLLARARARIRAAAPFNAASISSWILIT